MFQGLLVFGIGAIVLVVAYFAIVNQRRERREELPPEDRLTDEQFRRIEFRDEDHPEDG